MDVAVFLKPTFERSSDPDSWILNTTPWYPTGLILLTYMPGPGIPYLPLARSMQKIQYGVPFEDQQKAAVLHDLTCPGSSPA